MNEKQPITIQTRIHAPVSKVWACWNEPKHITQWSFAIDTWQCPRAQNDLRAGGKFSARMEAKDGSMGFDFEGVYTEIHPLKKIAYVLGDGRNVIITFTSHGENETEVIETFDPESTNPVEMQRGGWQSILNNFKKYVEKTKE